MTEEGKYIYSIIQDYNPPITSCNRSFGLRRPIGINNREVSLIHYKDISAVVSPTPVINFDRLDKKELTRHVTVHQQVNEEVMSAKGGSASGGKDYDVVPMSFGIIAPSTEEVLRILQKAYLQFKTALKKIEGRAEFVVQIWWNQKKVLEELTNTNLEIQKLKQKISSKSSILALPIKLKMGKLLYEKAENQRAAYIKDVREKLNSLSHDSTLNKLIDPVKNIISNEIEEDMLANFSFLIERVKESEFDKKMQELGKKYEGKLRFKYIGPMPPYSFVNINLSLGNFELVQGARKLLGLPEEAAFNEIKKAYYALARQYHPDKHQIDCEKDQNQMKKIIQAYSILENYCQSCDELMAKKENQSFDKFRVVPSQVEEGTRTGQKYSFKKEDVENSIIIK